MVLVITISLSNGGGIIYELDNLIYSKKITYEEEGIHRECLLFHKFGDLEIHEVVINDKVVQKNSRQLVLEMDYWLQESEFQQFIKPFLINEKKALEQVFQIPPGIEISHYYIQIKELEELHLPKVINSVIPIKGDWYVHVFSDTRSSVDGNFIRPISVKIEWEDNFSDYVLDSLKSVGIEK